jgi:pilus assembly protein CpaD
MPATIRPIRRASGIALTLGLVATLSGCGGMPSNRLLDSVHQPVVEQRQYQLDLTTGPDGLAPAEQGRLDGWFGAIGLRYGDRIAIDDPLGLAQTRAAVTRLAARYGLLVSATAPVTPGFVDAGTVRIIVLRATASVPHCPDLASRSESNFNNATSSNYGCAVNSNLAAMVANPDDLLRGAHGPSLTTADTSDKAIWLHQAAIPTGQAGVTKNSTN